MYIDDRIVRKRITVKELKELYEDAKKQGITIWRNFKDYEKDYRESPHWQVVEDDQEQSLVE
jgi:hypothetical protein